MRMLRTIAKVNCREQWDNHITNGDIRESLGVVSVEVEVTCVGLGMCKGCRVTDCQRGFCRRRFRVLRVGVDIIGDLWMQLGMI